jgi:septin 7
MPSLIATANGGVPAQPMRASPSPNVPNGKAPAPIDRQSPPVNGGQQQQQQQQQHAQEKGPISITANNPKMAAQIASDNKNIVRRKLTGYVGFANLPNQWHRKSVRKGFNFNVMVVGA